MSRLMALAIRLDQLIRDGVVADQAELARLGHVSRARLTQIMNLLFLAPDIQETLLFLPPCERGRDPITERELRPIAAVADWERQRGMWERMVAGESVSTQRKMECSVVAIGQAAHLSSVRTDAVGIARRYFERLHDV